jgi:DNA-binding LacI/PurR family transcriptional regulator
VDLCRCGGVPRPHRAGGSVHRIGFEQGLAEAVAELIEHGHPEAAHYTPRRIGQLIVMRRRRERRQMADWLQGLRAARFAKKDDFKGLMRELKKDV